MKRVVHSDQKVISAYNGQGRKNLEEKLEEFMKEGEKRKKFNHRWGF